MELAGHAPQDSLIDVIRPVGGAHDQDLRVPVRDETVPENHELRLNHAGRLVVLTRARAEKRVWQHTTRQSGSQSTSALQNKLMFFFSC